MQVTKLHTSQSSETNKTTRPLNRRLKTISSMHLDTESPEIHFQQSAISKQHIFINNQFVFTDQKNHKEEQMTFLHDTKSSKQQMIETNRAKQIQDDSDEISRMKLMFQSRLQNQKNNKTNIYNKSMDRSPHSKSIQKHTLKPTNTPNLNKMFLISQQPKQYLQRLAQSPNFSYQNKHNQHPDFHDMNGSQRFGVNENQNGKDSYERKNPQLNIICPSTSSEKKNILECSGISSKFGEYEFGSQIKHGCLGDINKPSQIGYSEKKSVGNHLEFNYCESQTKRQIVPKSINCAQQQKGAQCNCQNILKQFMQETSNKMAQITERLITLQNQNARLKKLESQFIQNTQIMQQYKHQAESMETECNQLKESNYSYQVEKEELQLLLKEILFKRQKEKYQRTSTSSSKENTQRYDNGSKSRVVRNSTQSMDQVESTREEFNGDDAAYEKIGDISFKKDTLFVVKKNIEPLGVKSTNITSSQKSQKMDKKQQNQSDSKIKMQNLLSKIQIKIEKS